MLCLLLTLLAYPPGAEWAGSCAHCLPASLSCAEYESDAWDLERSKLQEKHLVMRRQLEEAFLLHRHQMTQRHKKVLRLALAHPLLLVEGWR